MRTAKVQEKRDTALKLRIGRLSFQAVATHMGISKTYAFKLVRDALNDLAEHTRETADELRQIDSEALDRMQTALWKRCLDGDTEAIRVVSMLMNQRARLFGYEAPVKVETNQPGVSLDAILAAKAAAEKNG